LKVRLGTAFKAFNTRVELAMIKGKKKKMESDGSRWRVPNTG
jgi:hypothetical protein